jgi:catechol 2,3-dioxygenase-like lactoylglutathione lyase family enzyme
MAEAKPRLVGLNHIALEVADVDAALSFYGQIVSFELRGRSKRQVIWGSIHSVDGNKIAAF